MAVTLNAVQYVWAERFMIPPATDDNILAVKLRSTFGRS